MRNSTLPRCLWSASLAATGLLLLRAAFAQTPPAAPVQTLPPAAAQTPSAAPDPAVSLSPLQVLLFRTAFQSLSQQAHVTFVAEGQPLKGMLRPQDAPRLNPQGESLSQMAAEVAAAYDYDAERQGSVFVLRKRYTDPADLPDVTLAECAEALSDLQKITGAVSPHLNFGLLGSNEAVASLLTSLTPEQLERMRDKSRSIPSVDGLDGAIVPDEEIQANSNQQYDLAVQSQGLPLSTLMPEQRDVVRQILMVVCVQLPTLGLNAQKVSDAAEKDPRFCWHQDSVRRSFGYETSDDVAKNEGIAKKEATKTYTSLVVTSGFASLYLVNGKPPVMPPDPTQPPLRPETVPVVESVSLARAMSDLDARDAAVKEAALPKMLVDAALAHKRVSLFGAENTPPAALFQALADVYGLSVRERSDHRLLLARHPLRIPADYVGFPEDIKNSMPLPLRRAVAQNLAREEAGRLSQPSTENGLGMTWRKTLTTSALRVLRTAAEPRLKVAKDGRVTLSSLGDREKGAFAVALSVPQVEGLVKLANQGIPPQVARFDEICLLGGPQATNKAKFDLALVLPVAGGAAPPAPVMSADGIDYTPNSAVVSNGTP